MSNDRPEPGDARFEDALARGLAEPAQPPSECPDAEGIAAFFEQSLPTPERRDLEVHIAACQVCQAHLAALVRTASLEDRAPGTSPSFGMAWWRDWRWLAPLATTAVVLLAVWAAEPDSVTSSSAPTVADGRANREAEASRTQPEGAVAPAEADTAEALDETMPQLAEAAAVPGNQTQERPDADTAFDDAQSQRPRTEQRLAEPNLSSGLAASPLRRRSSNEAVGFVTRAPDETAVWRVVEDGGTNRVEYSADGGVTWTEQSVTESQLTAGSSPSGLVCWLGGRAGTILRTTDGGATWNGIEAPLPDDIVGVAAQNADTVTIEYADGQSFYSEDGGANWSAR